MFRSAYRAFFSQLPLYSKYVTRSKKCAKAPSTRYRHVEFQRALGEWCRKLRMQKGYSVNRLAKEAERLSPDAIIRLESGGVVTTVTLYRYAEILGVNVKDLFNFVLSDESTLAEVSCDGEEMPTNDRSERE